MEDLPVCFAPDPSVLPAGYGAWEDWNDPLSVELEEVIATEHNLPLAHRGPNPDHPNSPERWRGIPFNTRKRQWAFWNREHLPDEYKQITDWFSAEGLEEENRIAKNFHIPWQFRGPPTGPQLGGPKLWRGMGWRPGTMKWMKRSGKNLEQRSNKYGRQT